ncbi:E3 ubiquitin-protein ligase TRIM47-like isoform X2 [Colossoma macropomum]|uniref:E3 ubiquitin-protein ligase TRIM47-like isoform X2 n=1 Tax=Colossoma macropomum TaxID=42526 RepID=UPI001864B6E5|nr:E3 ubiquitin-protein ligase TRIM47-like isoform X2 [Colossoma macropomum]
MAFTITVEDGLLDCAICQSLLNEPVSTPCGHNFCNSCISTYLRQSRSCPTCRSIISHDVLLKKNTSLAEMVERGRRHEPERPCSPFTGWLEEVPCDICSITKHKAVKSCLQCMVSYCECHVEPHRTSVGLQRHLLTDALPGLEAIICPQHSKLLDLYCRVDQKCICLGCLADQHKGHIVLTWEQERIERQKYIRWITQEKEKQVHQYNHPGSASMAKQVNARTFTDLTEFIEKWKRGVDTMINSREIQVHQRAAGAVQRLQREISDLRGIDKMLEGLSDTHNYLQLQQFPTNVPLLPTARSVSIPRAPDPHQPNFNSHIREVMSSLRNAVMSAIAAQFDNIQDAVNKDLPFPE